MSTDMYRANILDHYKNPHNYGSLDGPDIAHEDENPLCGDEIRIELNLNGEGCVDEIRFQGRGCAISQAAASMLTDTALGSSLADLSDLTRDDMLDMLGIQPNPMRMKCALLALKILQAGIAAHDDDERGE